MDQRCSEMEADEEGVIIDSPFAETLVNDVVSEVRFSKGRSYKYIRLNCTAAISF